MVFKATYALSLEDTQVLGSRSHIRINSWDRTDILEKIRLVSYKYLPPHSLPFYLGHDPWERAHVWNKYLMKNS